MKKLIVFVALMMVPVSAFAYGSKTYYVNGQACNCYDNGYSVNCYGTGC